MAPVTGTGSNDNITFQGDLQQVTASFVNPYSGTTISVNDTFYVNNTSYDGLGGTDMLNMSPNGDFLMLNDGNGNPTITNIERIFAGAGGDVILLADSALVLNNMLISGGDSDDVIWGNVGNDTVVAGNGDDIVDGGPGNDVLNGENGNDILYGWIGNDTLSGGNNDDTLYGGAGNDTLSGGDGDDTLFGDNGLNSNPSDFTHNETLSHSFTGDVYAVQMGHVVNVYIPPGNREVSAANVTISYATTITATYVFTEAGYANSVGFYRIGADGTIRDVDIVMKNQHQQNYGDQFTYSYNGSQGDTLGIFIVANGYNADAVYRLADTDQGSLHFYYHFGQGDQRAATVNDSAADVKLVWSGIADVAFNVDVYHSSLSGGASTLNADGIPHMVSGLADANNPGSLRVGFEDLYSLGDADFDDVVFDISVASRVMEVLGAADNDYLEGGNGNDVLYGGFGNDVVVGGAGTDQLYGGDGSDIFAFKVIDNQKDFIHDYQHGADFVNLSNLLTGFDPLTSAINDFVHLVHNGSDDDLYVDANGSSGGSSFQLLATILGGTGVADAAAMYAEGSLVLDHSVVV